MSIKRSVQAVFSYLNRVPVLTSEWVLGSLLEPFLAFREALVPIAAISLLDRSGFLRDSANGNTDFPTAIIVVSNEVHNSVDRSALWKAIAPYDILARRVGAR